MTRKHCLKVPKYKEYMHFICLTPLPGTNRQLWTARCNCRVGRNMYDSVRKSVSQFTRLFNTVNEHRRGLRALVELFHLPESNQTNNLGRAQC